MDEAETTGQRASKVAASFSEANIESQLLEDHDEEMSPPATEAAETENGDEDAVSDLLKDEDTDMKESKATEVQEDELCSENNTATRSTASTAVSRDSEQGGETQTSSLFDVENAQSLENGPPIRSPPLEASSEPQPTNGADLPATGPQVIENAKTLPFSVPQSPEASSSSHKSVDAVAITSALPPNYPPVIHPSGNEEQTANAVAVPPVSERQSTNEDNGAEGMEIDDDEDTGSELSEGEELRDDLEDALDDANFSFKGSFYHADIQVTAPNPCLQISGLGLVGLPLSERDAKAVISCATLAPFGHGERTVVDKDVRDTWEIEPARVAFANPEWEKYINRTVCQEVCKSLAVTVGNPPPRMELYKLLLYETGSHFLPHQDTQKADGMFATVILILPSAYTGGQVVVSHASTTKTIDFAPNSLLSTALLAWYTDVKHEVKAVTSGYRLALSYNLIHVAPPGVPLPCLPTMDDSVLRLRRVLQKWREDKYSDMPEPPLIVYILARQYSKMNLKEGARALKGADAHRATFVRSVAEELGYTIGLASLSHNVSGYADDNGGHYHRRGRYGGYGYSESESEETPGMAEVEETATNISGLVDLDGASVLSFGEISIGDDCMIPREPFEDASPDNTEYEGYMGNGAGSLAHWYHRTAMVIMHQDDVDDICFSVGGVSYALDKLKRFSMIPPTPDDRFWAARIMGKSTSLNKDQALAMLDYSLKWKDPEMWKVIMKCPSCALGVVDLDILLRAWKTFSFESVRLGFEDILARSTQLQARINFIYNLKAKVSPEGKAAVWAWCKKESDKVLSSYTTPDPKDIPAIMSVIRVAGFGAFVSSMLPNLLKKPNTYAFWIAFIKALREGREAILERLAKKQAQSSGGAPANSAVVEAGIPADAQQPHSTPETTAPPQEQSGSVATTVVAANENVVDTLIEKCLQVASSQWSAAAQPSYGYYSHNSNSAQTSKVDRIIELIDQALICDNMNVCRTLFVDILKSPGTSAEKFTRIYTPLIPRLRTLLTAKNRELCASPFVDLMQVFIGTYLRDVLGKKGQIHNCRLRKIGCGCGDCGPLDAFILNPSTKMQVFRLAQIRRQHLERQIATAPDLCTYTIIRTGSPHGVQVTKKAEVVNASMWVQRQKDAKTFLASIGSDDVIAKIMGARYADVTHAVNGTYAFGTVRAAADIPVPPLNPQATAAPNSTPAPMTALAAIPPMASLSAVPPMASLSGGQSSAGGSRISAPSSTTLASGPSATSSLPTAAATTSVHQVSKKRKSNAIQLGPVIDLTGDDSS